MSDHIWDFVGHEQILVGQWPMTDSYLQPWFCVFAVRFFVHIILSFSIELEQSQATQKIRSEKHF